MKILCLHGYTQSGSLFSRKASGVRKALMKAGHELYFIDGPMKIELNDLPFEPTPEMAEVEMRGWWGVKKGDSRYGDTTDAMNTVKEAVEKLGPIDGILGFSQGAGLTALLSKALTDLVPSHPPLKFVILYSSFMLRAESAQHWYETPFTTPSLHVMGTLDTLVPEDRSMQLVNCWDHSKVSILKHPGGHYTPSQKPMLQAVVGFVNSFDEALSDNTVGTGKSIECAKADTSWNEFDKIGQKA